VFDGLQETLTLVTVMAGGAAFTVTFLEAVALPPAPAHAMVYVTVPVAVGVSVAEPLVASIPDHAPDAVQDVAFVEPHVIVVELPNVKVEGDALMVTVGLGAAAYHTSS
jgi:hypothetical protein